MARSVRAPLAPPQAPVAFRSDVWLGWALFAVTLLAYAPALNAGFIWNDSDYVTALSLRGLEGLWRIWSEFGATEQYYPFLHSAFWLEHKVWGDAPLGYHLCNVLLHATSACLLAAVLRRLSASNGRNPGGPAASGLHGSEWLVAFIFALHPVCVESVAWISEQKNTLSLVFYLAAALLYLRFEAERRARTYVLATVFFAVALLSKSVTATLPAALLVVGWWRRGRIEWRRDVWPLLPWFLLGAGMGLISAYVEKVYIGAHGSGFDLSMLQRGLLAGRIAWFYLGKILWPADLIFIYPRWDVDPGEAWQWIFPVGVLVLLAGLWWWRTRSRAPLAAALFFGGSLFPTLGFFNVYAFIFSYVADHWQYLPGLGVIVLVGSAIGGALRQRPFGAGTRVAVPVMLIAGLGALTFHQSRMYADMRTFYTTTLARNPSAWMAHNNLASLLRESGDLEAARLHYEAAIRVRPNLEKAHNNLGSVLHELRRPEEAMEQFQQALALKPDYPDAHNNLGRLLREQRRADEAIAHFQRALEADSDFVDARNNLGIALRDVGRVEDSIRQFEQVIRKSPAMATAHLNLALSLSLVGRNPEAMEHFREARRLNPLIPDVTAR